MSPVSGRDPLAGAEGTTPTASRMATSSASHSPASASVGYSSTTRRNEESWVEIASQPSSSSVSSITDEIVITGLRVGHGASGPNGGAMPVVPQRRRRLMQQVEAAHGSRSASSPLPSVPGSQPVQRHVSLASPARSTAGSSQEEYDETESEEDRMMSSSAENAPAPQLQTFSLLRQREQERRRKKKAVASDGDDEEDDDDDGTALGTPSSGPPSVPPTFSPQPNAFSHPPTHLQQQQQQQQYRSLPSPHQHLASSYARSSTVNQKPQHRSSRSSAPRDIVSAHREDNDAALRASLTTLLSCAAAARGLSNKKEPTNYGMAEVSGVSGGVRPSNQPMDICLVPESDLMADAPASPRSRGNTNSFSPPRLQTQQSGKQPLRSGASRPNQRSHDTATTKTAEQTHVSSRGSNLSTVSSSSKSKRSAAAAASGSAKTPRATKKKKTTSTTDVDATATFISPTLLTWVVSAGVVVLVSVVGFGAGFVLGREVGRQEAASASMTGSTLGSSAANATSSCGREIMRSSTGGTLRRFRWGTGMSVVA